MTEKPRPEPYGDALTMPFWDAAWRRQLVLQQCADCGLHQFYPRPFCLPCGSDDLSWVQARGDAVVYSLTTVHLTGTPYTVAVVTLAEGPRLTTQLVGADAGIGTAVRVEWQERGSLPPLPVFRRP